jgi:hypothetical protein
VHVREVRGDRGVRGGELFGRMRSKGVRDRRRGRGKSTVTSGVRTQKREKVGPCVSEVVSLDEGLNTGAL